MRDRTPWRHPAAWAGAVFVLASLGVYLAARRPAGHRALPYLVAHGVMALSGLAAWGALRRRPSPRAVALVVALGLVARVALVPAPSFTTTDVARYLWDGAVTLSGEDPYTVAPRDHDLDSLRARFPSPLDHHDVATCYPPLALGLFSLASAWGGALAFYVWKALVTAASCATLGVLWWHLKGGPREERVALLALSPLAVLEAGVGGHLDAFTALCVVAAVVLAERGRWGASALAAGCAGAVKLLPGLVVLPLALRAKGRARYLLLASLPALVTLSLAFELGLRPPGSLTTVARHWSFAAPLWSSLYHRYPLSDDTIRPALAVGGLAAMALVSLLPRAPTANARDAFGLGLAASPVLYPWYGLPLASLAALGPSAWALALLAVLPCSYEVLDGYQSAGRWAPSTWPMTLTTLAVALGLTVDAVALALARRRDRTGKGFPPGSGNVTRE